MTTQSKQRWYRIVFFLLAVLTLFLVLDRFFPLPDPNRMQSVIVLAEDDTPLRAFADKEGVWRYPVRLGEVSPLYIEALLTYEDRWFYYHFGVNPFALLRAAWQWQDSGRIISGGSTLTMQVARILDPHPRSLRGKLRQMFRALQLEWHFSKDEILNFYLNLAPFGGPIEGVQTAAYAYLHKPVSALSHAEAALLAVLPQAPSRLRPDRHPERARVYRDKVLGRMHELGVWSAEVVSDARIERVFKSVFRQPMVAPLFARRMKDDPQYKGVPGIRTTLDADLQWVVENIVQSRLGLLPDTASAAILVMENETGYVRAYAGSADFYSRERSGHVDMVQGVRSPGSSLKPFLYGMAFEDGLIHSASLLSDVPLKLSGYAPKNFLRDFRGAVTAAKALQLSLNVPAVDLLQRISPPTFDNRLQHGGVNLHYPNHEQANLSLILGGAGTRLEDLVRGFSAFAREGVSVRPRYTVMESAIERRLLSAEASWVVAQILRDVEAPPGFSAKQMGVSWKTGTSYGFRDAWALGFNQRYTVGVWTGRPDGTPLPGRYGARAAGPLLFEVFQALPAVKRSLPRPEAVTESTICWPLGERLVDTKSNDCQQQHQAWVIAGQVPPTPVSLHNAGWSAGVRDYWVNPKTGLRLASECSSSDRARRTQLVWPMELHPWLSAETLQTMKLPDFDPSCPEHISARNISPLTIQELSDQSVLQLPVGSEAGGKIRLSLQATGGEGEYLWLVNGMPVGNDVKREGLPYEFQQAGEYELTVLDRAANVDKINIRIVR
ncbi:MAG: penicillin-binding protein 1C [Thiolinea sp.]